MVASRTQRPTGDLLKVLDAISGVRADVQGLRDDVQAGHMRSDELARRISQVEALVETVSSEVAQVDLRRQNTAAELLASSRNGYRELTASVATLQDKVDRHDAEAIRSATEGAAAGGAKGVSETTAGNSERNRRLALAGIALGGVGVATTVGGWLAKGIALIQALAHVKVGDG